MLYSPDGHYVKICSCGRIVEECPCKVTDKTVIILKCGCRTCTRKALKQVKNGNQLSR